jgi:hypothetical protein
LAFASGDSSAEPVDVAAQLRSSPARPQSIPTSWNAVMPS